MVIYFSGPTYNQVIKEVIERTEQVIFSSELSEEIDFLKTVKQNISKYESIDMLILDESACKNTAEELITGLDMIRIMYDKMRIIVFAPYREAGDDFLTKCFNMGIFNIIQENDYLKIRQELFHCIVDGKSYKEASVFKESKKETVTVKHEIRRTVNKRLIGLAGVEGNIGVTHNTIVLANYFRKQGFMVALVEMNMTGAFEKIRTDFGEKMFQEGYFTLNGVDFYENFNSEKLPSVMEHSYNIILLDFGAFQECDRTEFTRCEDRIIIAGSKSWELEETNKIFSLVSKEALMEYIFCFNLTAEADFQGIRDGMGEIKNVHFLNYTVDPFSSFDFADANSIFADVLPEKIEEKKNGFMAKLFRRG